MIADTPLGLGEIVGDYLDHVRARGGSPHTLAQYQMVLEKVFLPWCSREGVEAGELDQRTLDRFTTTLNEEGGPHGPLSKASVRTYGSTVNFMLTWARKEGRLNGSTGKAQLPTKPRRIVDTLDREEIRRLEDACQSERDRLIVRLLADTGMRASELLGLRTDDLIREGRDVYLRVYGSSQGGGAKGDQARLVPVTAGFYDRLKRYATNGRPANAADDHIFLALKKNNQTDLNEPLTLSGLEQVIRWAGKRAEIAKPVFPHVFRHSFVTHALRKGMSPVQIAQIVGHRDLGMINEVYQHLNQTDARRALMDLLRNDD